MMGEYSLYNSSADQNQDFLAHYGRLGMKWYQHIYGEYQGAAKYAEKGRKKREKLLAKGNDKTIDMLFDGSSVQKINDHSVKLAKKAKKLEDKIKDVEAVRDKAEAKQKKAEAEAEQKKAKELEKNNPLKDVDVTQRDKDLTARINKDYYSPDTDAWSDPPKDEINKAADLGLKALIKQGMAEESDVGNPGRRDWFLYEDQTIGMPTVAHLINKGHSAKDVKEFIRKVNDAYDNTDDDNKMDTIYDKYFDLLWGDGLDGFADDCEKVKQRESVKHYAVGSTKTYVGLNEYSLYNPDSELAHHGILGMKWGVRRYQNADGSLTPLGRKRFEKSKNNRFLNWLDKGNAKAIYLANSRDKSRASKSLSKMSEKEARKANKLEDVDSAKSAEHERLSKAYAKKSNEFKKVSDMFSQKVKDIDSGVLKAGEDFIVQTDIDWYILGTTGTYTIIENPKNKKV